MSHANISGKVCRKLAGVEIDESRKRKAERIEEAVAGAGRPKKKTKKSDDGWARRQVLRQLRHDLDPEVEEGPDEQRHHPLQRVRAQEEEARKGGPRGRPRQYTPEERKERRQEEQRLYKKTPAGKASHKAAVARYRKTDKGKATQARWTKTRAENLKAATRKKRERAREERMAQGMLPTGYGEHKPPDPSEARHSAHKDGLEEKQLTLLVNLTESPGEVTPLIFASADERFCCPLKHADRIYFGRAVDQTFTHEVGRRDAKFWHVGTRVSIAITVEQSRSSLDPTRPMRMERLPADLAKDALNEIGDLVGRGVFTRETRRGGKASRALIVIGGGEEERAMAQAEFERLAGRTWKVIEQTVRKARASFVRAQINVYPSKNL